TQTDEEDGCVVYWKPDKGTKVFYDNKVQKMAEVLKQFTHEQVRSIDFACFNNGSFKKSKGDPGTVWEPQPDGRKWIELFSEMEGVEPIFEVSAQNMSNAELALANKNKKKKVDAGKRLKLTGVRFVSMKCVSMSV
ncbi:unnamed protein product, partial [Symbiodinium pilosum]